MEYLTLKDIAIINMGQSPNSKTYNDKKKGIPFYQGKSDFGKINPIPRVWCSNPIKIAEKDDILISVRAPIGDTNIATERCCIGRGLASIRPLNKNINQKYLYYLLNSKYNELNKFGTGSTFKAITKDNLCDLKCNKIPNIREQIEVVKKLDNVNQIIEIKKKQVKDLNTIVKSQFVEMFGDPKLNDKNWIKAPMGDYMTVLTDFSSNGSYKTLDSIVVMYDEPNYAYMVRTTDLENEDYKNNVKYITEEAYNFLSKSKVYTDDIIMNKIGSAGKVYIMPDVGMPVSLGRNAFLFRYNNDIVPLFIYYLLKSEYGTNEISQYVRGAVTKTITKDDVRKVKIIVPPIELQNKFADIVKQIDKQKFESEIELRKIQKNIFYKWGR